MIQVRAILYQKFLPVVRSIFCLTQASLSVESSDCLVFGVRGDRLGAVICYTDNCRLTKLRTMKTYSFDAIIELVEEMSDDEQITLIDLIGRRLREKRRDEIALNIVRADEEYLHEQVFRGTVNDIMAELKR
ncbi:hypothetical protein QT989_22880 [Microcoleus sp. SVA1_B6]|uniref:hypothetical protein n=1 Tax=Microcoleus sp. SVA1_B6 TaxID=2818952 RepID=UPI002FD54415